VLYFHNIFQLDDVIIAELLEQLCGLLRDPKVSLGPILSCCSAIPLTLLISDRGTRSRGSHFVGRRSMLPT
jgi:hypothetical protein